MMNHLFKNIDMKTGIEQITEERQHQIEKYGFTGEHHAEHPEWYEDGQLIYAAHTLATRRETNNYLIKRYDEFTPKNWDKEWFKRLLQRPEVERIKIAAALLAAELDRLNALDSIRGTDYTNGGLVPGTSLNYENLSNAKQS